MEEIDRVPKDVIHEILLRLPIKSIIRFQLVSKQWYSLIFNPFFTKSHHLQLTKSPPLTLFIEYDYLSIIKFKASYYAERITKSNGLDLAPLDHVVPEIKGCRENYVIGSSDGLLCIYRCFYGGIRQTPEFICLYNPATRACRQITPPRLRPHGANASGFGFVPSISDCKIVMLRRVFDCQFPRSYNWKGHVYSMKDNEWTELDTTSIAKIDFVDCFCHAVCVAVLFNEALHWVVSNSAGRDFLLKFDLVEEEFELVKLSDHDDSTPADYYPKYRCFGTIEPNNLCYCQQTTKHFDKSVNFVDLWMLERYGEWDSWKKLFRFEFNAKIRRHVPHLLGVTSCGKVLIHTKKGLSFVCVSTDRLIYVRNKENKGRPRFDRTFVFKYVPSLASPAAF